MQSPPQIVEKHVHVKHAKPHHHLRKTAYIGGYIGSEAGVPVQAQPAIQKRIDTGVEATADAGVSSGLQGATGVYTKQVTFQRNPNFFADIFNVS